MTKTAALRFARMIKLMMIVAESKTVTEKLQFMRNGLENLMKFINEQGPRIEVGNLDKIDVLFYEWGMALWTIINDPALERHDRITARHLSDDLNKNKVRLEALKRRKAPPSGIPISDDKD